MLTCLPWLLTISLLIHAGAANLPPAWAQSAAWATISTPETGSFPQISTSLSAYDAEGSFVHGLTAADLRVMEDDFERQVTELSEERVGAQFGVAIAPGSSFDIRDTLGVPRYQSLLETLLTWNTTSAESGMDVYSLSTPLSEKPLITTDPKLWLQAILDYQPVGEQSTPNLQPLVTALDAVEQEPPRPGMGRAVLFITAPLADELGLSLQNLAARARQGNVRVFVWLVGPPYLFTQASMIPLQDLAVQTGGQFWGYSGPEALPSLGTLIEPMRYRYRLTYTSLVARSGAHQVAVEILREGAQASSALQIFNIDLQPPVSALILPPATIERTFIMEATEAPSGETPALTPAEQGFTIKVDFPDGYPRPLVRSTLYVDGVVADENTAEPFNFFTWDLSPYARSEAHTLQIEVVDSLGLTSQSAEVSVQINVPPPEKGVAAAFSRQRGLVIGLGVLLGVAALVLALVLGGRIQPHPPASRPTPANKKRRPAAPAAEPAIQPVEVAAEAPSTARPSRPGWIEHLHWPERAAAARPTAYLTPLPEAEAVTLPSPYPVSTAQLTLGRDPQQATLVLEDASVEPLHARLEQRPEGFWLVDAGSVAGVWVNYLPIAGQGAALQHGDLVHIGRYGFRFTLREPGRQSKPIAILQETIR